ncbi:MAG: hydroxyacid dehydrogenase [Planctomycetes bacterium]|nr:hydroxyacid dehydrogenase [Planctomycetota bacterium]
MSNQTLENATRDSLSDPQLAVVLLADSFRPRGLEALESLGCEVILDPSLKDDALVEAIANTNPDILVVRSTKITAQMLDASENLSVVIRAGAGYDTIDVEAASKRGIFVANCPNKNAIAVAELTWALILSCDRKVPDQVTDLRNGKWNKKEYAKANGLHGRTLGVIGLGGIGKEVIQRGAAFGMNIIAWSRSLTDESAAELGIHRCDSLLNLAKMSDVVTIHLASTPETKNIIDELFLDTMQDGAILINTSRGDIIDEQALIAATQEKGLCVGLDVYKGEPSSGEAEFTPEIVQSPVAYGTHHVGASTMQAQDAIAMEAVRIIETYVTSGEVLNGVNRAKSTPAKALISVRHLNIPGVLAHIFESISHSGVNVEEMENIIYEGAQAACARIQLDEMPTREQIEKIRDNNNVLSVTVSTIEP